MKTRVIGGLALCVLAGVLVTAAFAGERGTRAKAAGIKIGVSLAGYSTDFWSSYVAFEKAAGTKYGVSLVGPISSNGDAGKQATQIRSLIDQGVERADHQPGRQRRDRSHARVRGEQARSRSSAWTSPRRRARST